MPKSDDDFFVPEHVDTLMQRNQNMRAARDQMFLKLSSEHPLPANWDDFDACSEEVIPTTIGVFMTRGDCLKLARQLGSRLLIIDSARQNHFESHRCEPLTLSMVEDIAMEHGLLDLTPPKYNKHNSSFRFSDSAA